MSEVTTDARNVPALEPKKGKFIEVRRLFTVAGKDPFDSVEWKTTDAVIIDAKGNERFRQNDVEVPAFWQENTISIVAEKYFRVIDGVKETSAKQMFGRVADTIAASGYTQGYFTKETRDIFRDELLFILVNGMYAFNSPVWFNVGARPDPQCSACFIQSVDDTMESIMELAKKEVMLFKGGSGTGGNLSPLRSSWEQLSRGGWASGPVSFMKAYDSFAGVTKSGGTTRRAAKMQVLNVDHPDIMEQRNGEAGFIQCKAQAEKLAHDLFDTGKYSAEWNKPGNVYDLVQYQNANNSVRVTDKFMKAVEEDGAWVTKSKDGVAVKTYKARDIWREMAKAAWFCGDPGVQFDTTTNSWHPCINTARINASNPCSEYLFLDETSCNLGSLNLLKFVNKSGEFNQHFFYQAIDVSILAKDIIVEMASYPSKEIEENSHKFRTLGLGFTNLGALLTAWGLPYDSDEGRYVASCITAIMGGRAYWQSAQIAKAQGTFSEYRPNSAAMREVISMHHHRAHQLDSSEFSDWEGLTFHARKAWEEAAVAGDINGFRNAQVTVIAPTGTISFLMGCDTTGIEPMLGCVTYKKIVGGGVLMIPNNVVAPALENLGYTYKQIESIKEHIKENGTIHSAPEFKSEHSPVFAEALGDLALSPEAHLRMMAAVQPFISGGISKTVNLPADATPEDIEDIYMKAWQWGLKCVAVYRDGCKLSQPISTNMDDAASTKELMWSDRKKLPDERKSLTHKLRVGNMEGYVTAGQYDDGQLAELFIRVSKQGSFLAGMVDSFALAISLGLQHGVPLEVFAEKFKDVRFEPDGFTGNADIPMAKSLPDYLFRWLELRFGNQEKEVVEVKAPSASIQVVDRTVVSYDGPPCGECGQPTKRAGACYVCDSCGASTGCG